MAGDTPPIYFCANDGATGYTFDPIPKPERRPTEKPLLPVNTPIFSVQTHTDDIKAVHQGKRVLHAQLRPRQGSRDCIKLGPTV